MDIDEMKENILSITTDIGVFVPYEFDQFEDSDTWDGLADYCTELARSLARATNQIAGYAGAARRKANSL